MRRTAPHMYSCWSVLQIRFTSCPPALWGSFLTCANSSPPKIPGQPPCVTMRFLMSGLVMTCLMALLSLAVMPLGKPAGAKKP